MPRKTVKQRSEYHVLIADDDQDYARDLKATLETDKSRCMQADICTDSTHIISQLKKKHYDVVLLDIKMPKLTGRDALQLIKQAFPETHVIIVSDFLDEYPREELIRFGAYELFSKPVNIPKLKECIQQAIEEVELTTIKVSGLDLRQCLHSTARELIFKALRETGWHMQKTAELLNISRWCLERWMRKLHIEKTA
jgi:DNA-binding NtrC family response regulator